MLDTTHQNLSCAFAEEIVSYLYGEADEQTKTKFEAHLTNCKNCADELSAFGFVRSSVQQWRTEEFLLMQTPSIEIPFEKSPEIIAGSTGKYSWFTNLRQLFTLSPAWTTAFVAFAVCVGLTFIIINFSGSNDIAESKKTTPEKPLVSPAIENKTKQKTEAFSPEIAEESLSGKIAKPPGEKPEIGNVPQAVPEKSFEKISNNLKRAEKMEAAARNSNNFAPVRKAKDINNINKEVVAKNQKVPKLAAFDEVEDKSLRLSDLMAEVEDK